MRTLLAFPAASAATLALLLLLGAAPASAQKKGKGKAPAAAEGAAGDKPAEGDAPKVKIEKGAGGKKVYRITEEIKIEGKIQKPEAFYVLQKSAINYDWQELKQDFIPKIIDSVGKTPF